MKRKVSPFSSALPTRLSSFHCPPFSIFLLLHGLKAALRSSEITAGEIWVIGFKFFSTVFINSDIYILYK